MNADNRYAQLPRVMVAPNGARRTKADHPALPITIGEIVSCAMECRSAGADGIHAHVRDKEGRHILDSGLYLELISEIERSVPSIAIQITTEAVGLYSPGDQRELVREVKPKSVSVSLREMLDDGDESAASRFYFWASEAEIRVQHILYSDEDVRRLKHLVSSRKIPAERLQLLFVLGRYTTGQQSSPSDLNPFLAALEKFTEPQADKIDWAVCAFGQAETECLLHACKLGGKVRVGFENNLWNRDGSLAQSNAERVGEVSMMLAELEKLEGRA